MIIDVISKWIELIALVFMTGTVFCRLLVLEGGGVKFTAEEILPNLWRPFGPAIGLMAAASAVNLLARVSRISGLSFFHSVNMLALVISGTHFGRVWMIRISLLFLLAAVLLVSGKKRRAGRPVPVLVLVILLLVSLTESAFGHAADKGDFSLPEINNWFHLLGAEVWGGGLLALSLLVLPRVIRTAGTPGPSASPAVIAGIARRFSAMAGAGVAVMAVTAAINYQIYVGSIRALLDTPYGLTAASKIILFLAILNLGAFNRYISVPVLQHWAGLSPGKPGIAGRMVRLLFSPFTKGREGLKMALLFKKLVRAEMFLVFSLLLAAAFLSSEPPARHYLHMKDEHLEQMGHGPQNLGGGMRDMGGM